MSKKKLNTKELDSLLYLLTDTDRVTQSRLAERFGHMSWMEISYCLTNADRIISGPEKEYVRTCLEDASAILAYADFEASMLHSESSYVPDCMYYLTRILEPYLSPQGFRNLYESMGNELICELRDDMTAVEKVEMLNYVFFTRHGFKIVSDGDEGRKVLLTSVLKNREGGEIGLSSAYFLLARYADLPVYPVFPKNPGYFVGWFEGDNTLFTMDIFNKGRVSEPVPPGDWRKPRTTMGKDHTIYYVYAASLRYMGPPLSDKKTLLLDRAIDLLKL